MQAYSNPKRASDPHALPDVEVFELTDREAAELDSTLDVECGLTGGWYWQPCFPGCLPDGPPIGPFPSRAEALADAQSASDDEEG